MENNIRSKRKASSQCPPTLSAGGDGGGETWKTCNVGQKKGGLALFEFLKGEWIFSGGVGAEDFLKVIFNY